MKFVHIFSMNAAGSVADSCPGRSERLPKLAGEDARATSDVPRFPAWQPSQSGTLLGVTRNASD
ncbi:MAG TPA: hypothetical protein VL361_17840 [Candidatus Limnocylindrales bacterium]|jgi:hypothetical protein|nr:hypothetical protein [Candidatus Limnocylindrales bacterium]